jgi:hypothetical protein
MKLAHRLRATQSQQIRHPIINLKGVLTSQLLVDGVRLVLLRSSIHRSYREYHITTLRLELQDLVHDVIADGFHGLRVPRSDVELACSDFVIGEEDNDGSRL